jgi:hypothetical protein
MAPAKPPFTMLAGVWFFGVVVWCSGGLFVGVIRVDSLRCLSLTCWRLSGPGGLVVGSQVPVVEVIGSVPIRVAGSHPGGEVVGSQSIGRCRLIPAVRFGFSWG